MRKKIALLAAAALLALSLSACADENKGTSSAGETRSNEEASSTVEDPLEITLWTYPVGNFGNQTSLTSLLAGFYKEHPEIHVSVEYLTYNDGDARIEDALADGAAPDLVLEGPERLVANWGARGLMADLSDLWDSPAAGQIYSQVRDACRTGDAYYEFPICMTTHCMAINYDMFQAAGALQYLDEETRTWTTEGFLQAVQALYDYGQEQVGIVYCKSQGGDQGTRALVNNLYGGSFTDGAHTAYTIDSPENIQALETLAGMDGIVFAPDRTGVDAMDAFCAGEAAMSFCWNVSMEIQYTINNPDLDFEIFPMAFPAPGGKPRLQGGIWGFGIFDSGDAERVEAAKTFIRYMTEDEEQYTRTVRTSAYWPVREMKNIYTNDLLMTEYSIFTDYAGDYYQVTPGWPEARTAWWNLLQEVGGGADAAQAVKGFPRSETTPASEPTAAPDTTPTSKPVSESTDTDYIESLFVQKKCPTVTASAGRVAMPVFVIDFPDVKYTDKLASKEELEDWLFGDNEQSAASYYNLASYGRMQLEGNVYFYTAQNEVKHYESYEGIEWLIMEALDFYDAEVDFSQYDGNGDKYMDSLMISVPTYSNIGFWWAVTPTWGEDSRYEDYSVDDTRLWHYILNDFQPYESQRTNWVRTLEHEMGHSMGLPDYYKYENKGDDSQGLHGTAGLEMMDDSKGDFCQFSKLMLGWLKKDQVQIMPPDAKEETFFLPSTAREGGCILVFPEGKEADFESEYFLIEYNTPDGVNKGVISKGGVRVLHVQAEIHPQWDGFWVEYLHKYNNYSSYYDNTNRGIRMLKLVNDARGYYSTGDVVTYGTNNFGWYDKADQQKITDPGFGISIGEVQQDGTIKITVRRDGN